MRQGIYAKARSLLQESLALHWEVGTKHEAAVTLGDLGQLAQLEGDLEAALDFYERSLDLHREFADKPGIVNSLTAIGGVALRMGDISRAVEALTTAFETAKELGSLRYSIVALDALGWLMVGLGQPAQAALLLSAVETLYKGHPFLRPIVARMEHQRYLESARAGLDEVTWRQARQEGEAMSVDEALRFAWETLFTKD
jgi:tetratricopeptide (TPR) repeat protein